MPQDNASLAAFADPLTRVKSQDEESTRKSLQGLLDDDGPSMFDTTNKTNVDDPSTLSMASNAVLQDIIDHHGAIGLIQRLSTALAERDAHITALTRLAQEYNAPNERIADTAVRVKQAERRRLSLAAATIEELAPLSAVQSATSVRPPNTNSSLS